MVLTDVGQKFLTSAYMTVLAALVLSPMFIDIVSNMTKQSRQVVFLVHLVIVFFLVGVGVLMLGDLTANAMRKAST